MTLYILDTDILLDVLKGHQPAIAWFKTLTEVPSITNTVFTELMDTVRNEQQVHQMFQLIAPLPMIWPTKEESSKASSYCSKYLSDDFDSIEAGIAACAVERSATLCTFSGKIYQCVPNLKVLKPYTRSVRKKSKSK